MEALCLVKSSVTARLSCIVVSGFTLAPEGTSMSVDQPTGRPSREW